MAGYESYRKAKQLAVNRDLNTTDSQTREVLRAMREKTEVTTSECGEEKTTDSYFEQS